VLGLTTLETRMLRADLIQVFKILNNIDHVDKDKFFFTFAVDDRREHAFKLYKDRLNFWILVSFLFQICAAVGIIFHMIL